MSGFRMGLGCCDCGPGGCQARINIIMSDSMPMDESGITVTLTVRQGEDVILTVGPTSPSLSAIQVNDELSASTTYEAELIVEQEGGPTCSFVREFTTPAICNPFSFNMFIPRVWVRLLDCGPCDYHGACGQAISVAGPNGFSMSGTSNAYPDPPPAFLGDIPRDLCRFKFTPCAEGEYVITGSSSLPNVVVSPVTIDVDWGVNLSTPPIPVPYVATEQFYFYDQTYNAIKPAPGYVWDSSCAVPTPATLHMTSDNLGSATLVAEPDGECGAVEWRGSSTITLPTCGGGTQDVAIAWRFSSLRQQNPFTGEYTWTWELSGFAEDLCYCVEAGDYGRCVAKVSAGGGGEGWAAGSVLRAVTPRNTPFLSLCEDCSSLDISISVAFVVMRPPGAPPGGAWICPTESPPACWGTPTLPPLGGTFTVTS